MLLDSKFHCYSPPASSLHVKREAGFLSLRSWKNIQKEGEKKEKKKKRRLNDNKTKKKKTGNNKPVRTNVLTDAADILGLSWDTRESIV